MRLFVVLQALENIVLLAWLIATAAAASYFPAVPKATALAWAGLVVVVIVLNAALLALATVVSRIDGKSFPQSGITFPSRVHPEQRRSARIVLWSDLRQIALSFFFVLVALIFALHHPVHRVLDWIAVALFLIPATGISIHRFRTQVGMPKTDDTLLGTLTLLIYQTRRRAEFIDNRTLWWRSAPTWIGSYLVSAQVIRAAGGAPKGILILVVPMLAAVGFGSWRLNRWVLRSRLRPALTHLERFRASLLNEPESNQGTARRP
jgi:hypothetical protein